MSAIGSASARGPEMWSDTVVLCDARRPSASAASSSSGLQRRVLQRLRGLRIVEHLLERGVDPLRLPELLDGPAVVAGVGGGGLLRAQHERLDRREVREPVVALDVPEDRVEQLRAGPEARKSSM